MSLIPQFRTKRLLLRGITLQDADSYQKNFADYEVIRYLSSAVPWPYPEGGAHEFIRDYILPRQGKDRWIWGIFLHSNPDDLIGGIELWREENPDNRGFWLAREYWGQGIMSEALEPITNYAFTNLGFERLILTNAVSNHRSHNIKNKAEPNL